ncbi:hypothetical protein D9M71_776900 [compost metagenome]
MDDRRGRNEIGRRCAQVPTQWAQCKVGYLFVAGTERAKGNVESLHSRIHRAIGKDNFQRDFRVFFLKSGDDVRQVKNRQRGGHFHPQRALQIFIAFRKRAHDVISIRQQRLHPSQPILTGIRQRQRPSGSHK